MNSSPKGKYCPFKEGLCYTVNPGRCDIRKTGASVIKADTELAERYRNLNEYGKLADLTENYYDAVHQLDTVCNWRNTRSQ